MRKNAKKSRRGVGGAFFNPLWPRHSIWFIMSTLKDNCLLKLLLGKKERKVTFNNIWPTHTYKINILLLFFFLFCIFPFSHFMFTYPYRPLHHYPYPCIHVVQGARHRGGIPLKEGVGRSIVVIEEWPRWNWGRWKRSAAGANMTKTKFYSTRLIYVSVVQVGEFWTFCTCIPKAVSLVSSCQRFSEVSQWHQILAEF